MKIKKILFLFLIIGLLFNSIAYAKVNYWIEATISADPQNPAPNQEVLITIQSQSYSDNSNFGLYSARLRVNYGTDPNNTDPDKEDFVYTTGGNFKREMTTFYNDDSNHNITAEVCYQMPTVMIWDNPDLLVCENISTTVQASKLEDSQPTNQQDDQQGSQQSTQQKDIEESKPLNPLTCETLGQCFNTIATVLLYIAIVGISISIIVAGAIFLTGATPAKLALAKKILLWSVGLFAIMLLVKVIALVTQNDLTTN